MTPPVEFAAAISTGLSPRLLAVITGRVPNRNLTPGRWNFG